MKYFGGVFCLNEEEECTTWCGSKATYVGVQQSTWSVVLVVNTRPKQENDEVGGAELSS